jgi:ribosomal protein S18 acetylase RimI-like enzyme
VPGNLTISDDERLERIAPGQARQEVMPLLRLADDSAKLVESYFQCGELFALKGTDAATRGVVLAVPVVNGAVELKAVAVAPEWQRRGVGSRMIARILAELRVAGVQRVIVGTASCGIGQLGFYQKAGFRLWKIERNYFNDERGYPDDITENGIPLRDMVWMDQEI